MRENLYLPDGTMETVVAEEAIEGLCQFLRDHLGPDVERLFQKYLPDPDGLCKNCHALFEAAMNVDYYSALCHEADDNFQIILGELRKPHINKAQLIRLVEESYKALHNKL